MEQAKKNRLRAEQLVCLTLLKHGARPPGVRDARTVVDTVADARIKYYSHIWDSLQFFFPSYCRYRPPGFRKLVAMFDDLELATDQFENLDDMFAILLADVRRLSAPHAWHDLLLVERAIAKSRIAPRVRDTAKTIERRLRGVRFGSSRMAERSGLFFIALKTDLIRTFGNPGRDPRRARRIDGTIKVAIFRRPQTQRVELTWLA
jgi:hypothetical protein